MFLGEQALTLDAKNRLVLPSKFRTFLTEEDRQGFYMVVSPTRAERCLRLYPKSEWMRVEHALMAKADEVADPVEFLRLIHAHGEYTLIDAQFRFVVPQKLVDFAHLGRDVVMAGNNAWLEIWDPGEWETIAEQTREKYRTLLGRALWAPPEKPKQEKEK
jgi:MraZ protein